MKKSVMFVFATLIFASTSVIVGCGDEKKENKIEVKSDLNPPPDVPIAKSDANISIDRDFPPMPVAE